MNYLQRKKNLSSILVNNSSLIELISDNFIVKGKYVKPNWIQNGVEMIAYKGRRDFALLSNGILEIGKYKLICNVEIEGDGFFNDHLILLNPINSNWYSGFVLCKNSEIINGKIEKIFTISNPNRLVLICNYLGNTRSVCKKTFTNFNITKLS